MLSNNLTINNQKVVIHKQDIWLWLPFVGNDFVHINGTLKKKKKILYQERIKTKFLIKKIAVYQKLQCIMCPEKIGAGEIIA